MLLNLFRSLRPQQWVKNLAVLAPAFFAGQITNRQDWGILAWAFIILSLASSGSYLLNDLIDRQKDKLHPLKAHRPIAAGLIPDWLIIATSVVLLSFSLVASWQFPDFFGIALAAFVILQILYSTILKRIILLDLMVVATTFSLRVFAGAFILPVPISAWLILTTVALSLLLIIGKRRAEITLLSHRLAAKHREVISHYPNILLDGLTFMMASATLVSYALFTFNQPEVSTRHRLSDLLPQTLSNPKWLMITIPFVIYGIFRYAYVIYEKKEGRSPERILISDVPLLLTVVGWILASYAAVYILVR